jgi:hypothetical protein
MQACSIGGKMIFANTPWRVLRVCRRTPWLCAGALAIAAHSSQAADVAVRQSPGRVEMLHGDQPIATYVYRDPEITRPYFAHLHGPGGIQLSRSHPPIEGQDRTDHPEFHPGLWLAFGDLSEADSWRNRAAVKHIRMLQTPQVKANSLGFAVENEYLSADSNIRAVCHERCRYELHITDHGYLLTWDSTFYSDETFSFGDQEEMGLGIRVATPLRVETSGTEIPAGTGTILDSEGRRNADEVWGKSADWVDYSGALQGRPAGIALFCHPGNFRPSHFHARDYGFLAANPFSTAAFNLGEASKTFVEPGESLRLRYGILLHAGEALGANSLDAGFRDYLKITLPTTRQF